MTRRLTMRNGERPLVISVEGVDAEGAPYASVIFDGNFHSLPVYMDGTLSNNSSTIQWFEASHIAYHPSGLNVVSFGKTFDSPPLALLFTVTSTNNRIVWTGSDHAMQNVGTHRLGPFFWQGFNPAFGGSFDIRSLWTTTTALRAPRAGRFLVFDRPLV